MEPNELRRSRRVDRRARKAVVEVQNLEQRQLLAWSPLGGALPDLSISGYAAPVAAYGEEIAVNVTVQNFGTSTILEPLALEPHAPSTADAGPTTVTVYLSRSPRFGGGAVEIGEIEIPAIRQNSFVEVVDTVTMPPPTPGLPGSGGTVYLFFRIDADRQLREADITNNLTRRGTPVQIAAPLPELVGEAINVPPVMQPGDAIAPAIKIANFGTTNPNQQSSFEVALVASTDDNFGPGDVVLATYTVRSLPPLSLVPMQRLVLGDVNLNDPVNVLTIQTTDPVFLPNEPGEYFVGVVVDPQNVIREISEIGQERVPRLDPLRRVGPPLRELPPAGVLDDDPIRPRAVFPFVPNQPGGRLPTIYTEVSEPPIIVIPVEPGPDPIGLPRATQTFAAGPRVGLRADASALLGGRQATLRGAFPGAFPGAGGLGAFLGGRRA